MGKNKKKKEKLPEEKNQVGAYGDDHNSCWEIEIDNVKTCGKAPKKSINIKISIIAKAKMDALMKVFPHTEWFAYLLGSKKEPYYIRDIFIPKQTVTGTTVSEVICPEYNELPIIGAMHSHHGMGNGFSDHDHSFVNGNHPLSLVIARGGIAGQARVNVPCGAMLTIDIPRENIKVVYDIDFNSKEYLEETIPSINVRGEKIILNKEQQKYMNGFSSKEKDFVFQTDNPALDDDSFIDLEDI